MTHLGSISTLVFEIKQEKEGSRYMFSLVVGDEKLWSTQNTKPVGFEDVKVYAASPWYVAQAGSIRDLHVENKMRGTMNIFCVVLCRNDPIMFYVRAATASWTAWGEWSECDPSADCGKGKKLRLRHCVNAPLASACAGQPIETAVCTTDEPACQGFLNLCFS